MSFEDERAWCIGPICQISDEFVEKSQSLTGCVVLTNTFKTSIYFANQTKLNTKILNAANYVLPTYPINRPYEQETKKQNRYVTRVCLHEWMNEWMRTEHTMFSSS